MAINPNLSGGVSPSQASPVRTKTGLFSISAASPLPGTWRTFHKYLLSELTKLI